MKLAGSRAHLLRTRALALLAVAVMTAGMILGDLLGPGRVPLMLPIIVAYLLFNFGFGITFRAGCLTRASRLGCGAVLLNLLAMLLSDFDVAWQALSTAAIIVSLGAAYMLFVEARAAAA